MAPDTIIEEQRAGETDAQYQERLRREGRDPSSTRRNPTARETPTERRAREARGEHPYVETTAEHDARNKAANATPAKPDITREEPHKIEGSYDEINREKEVLQAAFERSWPTWRVEVREIWPKLTDEHMVSIGNDFLKLRAKIEMLYPIQPDDEDARAEFEAYFQVDPIDGSPDAAEARNAKRWGDVRSRSRSSPNSMRSKWPKLTEADMQAIGNDREKLRARVEQLYPEKLGSENWREEFNSYWDANSTHARSTEPS